VEVDPSSPAFPVGLEATRAARTAEARAGTIWALAWPVIATFALESLVGLIDTLMVGRLGARAVAAVGVGAQIMGAVAVAMTAVGTGTLAVVARQVGARETRDAEETLAQSAVAALGLSLVTISPVLAWAPGLVRAFGVEPEVVDLGAPFVRVVMLSIPAGAVLFVLGSALRAAGDTRTPLAIGIVVNVVNVAGNYVLIFGKLGLPALGVLGSAIGSVLAFWTGAALGLVFLAGGSLRLRLRLRRPALAIIRRVLSVGYPAAAEQLLMQLGFFIYLVFAARYGTSAVAAYFIGVRILALSFLPGHGFAAAAATLVGQHLGGRAPALAEHSAWEASRLAVSMMSAAGLVIFLAARPIARAFVDDPDVVEAAVSFIRVLAAAQPLMAIDFTLGGALRGAGDTRFPLLAVLVGFYACRLVFAYVAAYAIGASLFWVWCALVGDYAARVVLKTWRFRSGRWTLVAL
jgi:putative MATE family efflux protein